MRHVHTQTEFSSFPAFYDQHCALLPTEPSHHPDLRDRKNNYVPICLDWKQLLLTYKGTDERLLVLIYATVFVPSPDNRHHPVLRIYV